MIFFIVEMIGIEYKDVRISNSIGQHFDLTINKFSNKIEIDVSGLQNGIYFLNTGDNTRQPKISFVKTH